MSLPNVPTTRMVERTHFIEKLFDREVKRSFYVIAYVSAVCFILVGATYALFSTVLPDANLASVYSTTDNSSTTDDEIIDEQATTITGINAEPPNLDFLTTVPNLIDNEMWIVFSAVSINDFWVGLRAVGTNKYTQLPFQALSERRFKFLVDPNDHDSGYYALVVKGKAADGSGNRIFDSRVFFLGSAEAEIEYNQLDPDEKEEDITNDEPLEEDTTTKSENEDVVESTSEASDENEKIAEEVVGEYDRKLHEEEDAREPVPTEPVKVEAEKFETSLSFFKFKPFNKSEVSGVVSVPFVTNYDLKFIELYARPVSGSAELFVGLAINSNNEWRFVFDTTKLKNGKYEFKALSKTKDNHTVKSTALNLLVNNPQVDVVKTENEISLLKAKTSSTSVTSPREFLGVVDEDISPSVKAIDPKVDVETKKLIDNNKTELNELAKRYAVAIQSGDDILIETVKRELTKTKDTIVLSTLNDNETQAIFDDVNEEFTKHIKEIEGRVETFERLRSDKSSGETSEDSDKDGISDYDEVHIFKTNPLQIDSDNDGTPDGIEVVKGFDPSDPNDDALIQYDSPKNFKVLERDDVLTVETVTPIESIDSNIGLPSVRAEIKGKALPNSYVTLFIYSTPTIVTIKTDADGSFIYTFNKELEDGEHEVYVAVTDNAGAIIAQSKPFAFVKEAQAFSVVGANETDNLPYVPLTTESNNSSALQTIIGLGILALGLILLMLGISLRSQDEKEDSIVNLSKKLIVKQNLVQLQLSYDLFSSNSHSKRVCNYANQLQDFTSRDTGFCISSIIFCSNK